MHHVIIVNHMSDSEFTYEEAGVDLEAAGRTKERIRALVEGTRTRGTAGAYGSFGGRFDLPSGERLVASADGVGTKLLVAVRADRHDTVGEDLVNHCVDDLLTEGAEPLFFLDYVATGALEEEVAVRVVEGVARGCRENGVALLGGETAEMPDLYAEGEYDLAGFLVGWITWAEVADRDVGPGDALLALESDGLHTNGYTFARRILFERMGLEADDRWPGEEEGSVADVLLRVHRSYLRCLRPSLERGAVRALAHVTGGGIAGNLSRVLPPDTDAEVHVDRRPVPDVFRVLGEASGAGSEEMFRVFNMGIGMVAVVDPGELASVRDSVRERGCDAWDCGRLVEGEGAVRLRREG